MGAAGDLAGGRASTVTMIDGVVHVVLGRGARVKLADADALMTQTVRAAGEGRIAVLLDISAVDAMSRSARRIFFGELGCAHISALALVARTDVSRMIAAFISGLSAPPFPARVFEDRLRALEWLESAPAAGAGPAPGGGAGGA